MHYLILANRTDAAHARIVEAAKQLAERFDIPDAPNIAGIVQRDPAIKAMLEKEAIADLLESVVKYGEAEAEAKPEEAEDTTHEHDFELPVASTAVKRGRKPNKTTPPFSA
jgi:hypothetical protein